MSDEGEPAIDAGLRDVPVPEGLPQRVAPAALFDDAAIDRMLLRVDVPAGLGDRVRAGCSAAVPGLLDAVPPPVTAARPRGGRFPAVRRIGRSLVAISADFGAVAVALGLVAAMFLAGTELSRRMAAPVAIRPRSPGAGGPVDPENAGAAVLAAGSTRSGAAGAADPTEVPLPRPAAAGRSTSPPATAALATASGGDAGGGGSGSPAAPTVAEVEVRAAPDTTGWVEQPRAAGRKGMRTVALPEGGRAVPRTKGFDLVFEMTHGEPPFVDPGANPSLAVDRPPLVLRTGAFDALVEQNARELRSRRARGTVGRKAAPLGATPGAAAVEELLAALPPPWDAVAAVPPPSVAAAQPARMSISAVRSLRAEPAGTLVEICAAPPQPARGTVAADTIIVVDASTAAATPHAWSGTCRGLARIAARMGPTDRVSLVVCGPRPRLAALRADALAVRRLLPELEAEPLAASADLDAAWRLVDTVARREGTFGRVVVVARADTVSRCRDEARAAFASWRDGGDAATGVPRSGPGVAFVVVDPQASAPDASMRTTAGARVAADAVSIGRAMLAEYEGRPTLAASGCRLSVAFDPKSVGSYRLVGFRQTAAAAVSADGPAAIDMHVGEWVRVVYEVVGRPGATPAADAVAATFEWTGAGGAAGQRQRTGWKPPGPLPAGRSPVTAVRELPGPAACELLLAVACGEIACGSPHAEPRRQSLAAAGVVASRWKSRGDVTPTGGLLIDALQRLGMPQDAAAP
jgi:hypothetical protein